MLKRVLFPGGDLKGLSLNLDADGLHKGTLNISLIAYDRYGNIICREDRLVALSIKADARDRLQTFMRRFDPSPRLQYFQ